jgi:hypothetical protein
MEEVWGRDQGATQPPAPPTAVFRIRNMGVLGTFWVMVQVVTPSICQTALPRDQLNE